MAKVLELKRETRTVKFEFKGRTEERKVEVRFDPITGRRCRILEKAILVPPGSDFKDILDNKDCPFCGTRLEEATPSFLPQVVPGGKIREGKVVLLPNLYPYADHTAVVVFKEHFKPVEGFSLDEITHALRAAKKYIVLSNQADRSARFCSVNWNYMPPSGGTEVHPHLQVIVDRYPTFLQELMIKGSKEMPGVWGEYVALEKKLVERYIQRVGRVHLIAPFAPMGFDQVDGIFEGVTRFDELNEDYLMDLASAVRKVLEFYGSLGRSSFNMAIYSSEIGKEADKGSMALNFKMLGRSNLRPFYRSDAGYTERLHYESVVNKPPEMVAAQMRQFLGIK